METYKIIRFFEYGQMEVIKKSLSLEDAQEHCQREDTSGIDENGIRFFDGYTEE